MKTRLLPDLDLARIAPLPRDEKRAALRRLRIGIPPYSYAPTRRSLLDILNVEARPLGVVDRAPWANVALQVARMSKSDAEQAANLAVAEALYRVADENGWVGRRQEFFPLAIGIGAKVAYWLPAVMSIDGKATAIFMDPRRADRLTREGRRFAFSAMHERIRAADPDYAEVELAIVQLDTVREVIVAEDGSKSESITRIPRLHIAGDMKLFDFSEIDDMVRETYEIWAEVLADREDAARKKTGTGGGGLFD